MTKEHIYVFATQLEKHLDPSCVLVHLKHLLVKADLPDKRFHDLPHTVTTLLLSQGVHPKVVQELLGHSTISMMMDVYSHGLPNMQQDAIHRMNEALK